MENKTQNSEWIVKLTCIVKAVLKQYQIILLTTFLCASLFDVYKSVSYTPLYEAKTIVAILDSDAKGLDADSSLKSIQTLQYLFNSSYMKKQVNDSLNQTSFNGYVTLNITTNTNLCTISVYSSTQKDAFFQLNELLTIYQEQSQRNSYGYILNTIEDITFTNYPLNNNNHMSNYKKGFVVGLTMSVALLVIYYYLKDNIKTANMVNDKLDASLIAKIPKEFKKNQRFNLFKKKKTAILVSHFNTGFSYVESMNKLAKKIEKIHDEHKYKTFLITSSLENEGKSSVAVNLAISLAKNNHKVLLVDADMRKPAIHKIFEKDVVNSLADILEEEEKWKNCVVSLEREQIDVIFSTIHLNSQVLLADHFESFIRKAKRSYEYIIVDSAPSRYIQDTSMIASLCDATLLVVQQNNATCKIINDTIYHLVNNRANVIGTIFNGSVYDFRRVYSSYGYRYGYYRYHREGGSK